MSSKTPEKDYTEIRVIERCTRVHQKGHRCRLDEQRCKGGNPPGVVMKGSRTHKRDLQRRVLYSESVEVMTFGKYDEGKIGGVFD